MNIDAYTFDEYRQLAENFHNYAAPGLLLGGYMVALAKRHIPDGTLYEATVETNKCLPDAVQLLTPCSTGNNWMKVVNLGRYAVSLYDKFTGEGVRVSLDAEALQKYPEIIAWFLKTKTKAEQDSEQLEREIRQGGESLCRVEPIRIKKRFLGKHPMQNIDFCPICHEAYPTADGKICRGCQGERPYNPREGGVSSLPLPDQTAQLTQTAQTIQTTPFAQSSQLGQSGKPVEPVEPVESAGLIEPVQLSKTKPPTTQAPLTNVAQLAHASQSIQQKIVPVEEAVGLTISHDLTRIEPGVFKGPEFKAGHRIQARDLCRLQQMGRLHVAVEEGFTLPQDMVHENEAAELLAHRMAGQGVTYTSPPSEGKIDFLAAEEGLFTVDIARMKQCNMVSDVMVASRQDATIVAKGSRLAGTRIIPLHIQREILGEALAVLDGSPIFSVLPMRQAKMGVLVTGTEVFQGIIHDKFIPVMEAKAKQYNCQMVKAIIVPDERTAMQEAIAEIREAGADILVTTGGLSVDPDDVTRSALLDAGLTKVIHGVPVLPGAMSVIGELPGTPPMQVLGVPACALYFKTTFFDLVFPRLLAGRAVTREEIAELGVGGYCLSCKICTYPKCAFGK